MQSLLTDVDQVGRALKASCTVWRHEVHCGLVGSCGLRNRSVGRHLGGCDRVCDAGRAVLLNEGPKTVMSACRSIRVAAHSEN